jgi:hypothetical protein
MVTPRFDPATGQMVAMQSRSDVYKVEKGEKLELRPEVEKISMNYRGLQYGWTDSDEFKQNYRPKIIEQIKKIRQQNAGLAPQVNPLTMIRSMTEEQINELRSILAGGPSTPAKPEGAEAFVMPSVEEIVSEPPVGAKEVDAVAAEVAAATEVQTYSNADLLRKTAEALKIITTEMGIFKDGMVRSDMISAILQAQKAKEAEVK